MKLTLLFLLISLGSFAQITCSSNTKADIAYLSKQMKIEGNRVSDELRNRFAVNRIGGKEYVSFVTKKSAAFDKADLEGRGILVGSQINGIVSIKYPLSHLEEVFNETGFSYIHIAGKVRPLLNKVPIGTHADSVWMGYGLPESYTGKDVIIGITDWGFDYSSPMFYDTLLQNTRILAAWDQYKTSGPAPAGYSYGTEYSTPTEFVNAGSDTSNIYSYHTHGTHVAGIAGGSGAGTVYRGIGFECNYLFTTFLVDEGSVLDAWEWMYNKATAEGKRLVVNMSWGLYHMDAIDGTALVSQALDAYSDLGVVFITSAGNNGGVNFHIAKDFTADTLKTRIAFYANPGLATVWGQSIHMWGEVGNSFSSAVQVLDNANQVVVASPYYSTATTTAYIDSFLVANGTDTVWFNLSADASYPTNGRPQTRLRVKYPPAGYKIVLVSAAPTGKVHYWNVTELTNDVGNWGMDFTSLGAGYTGGNNEYGIGIPACSNSSIAIGAYSSEFLSPGGTLVGGASAAFSSNGPLITDSLKPDISAPGVSVCSSMSSYTDYVFTPVTSIDFNGRTYPFANLSGTSMSSPATAGVVALVLDANPYLSAQQVKMILITTARQDNYTGAIPPHSVKWGWGKVNAYAAVKLALMTTGTQEIQKQIAWKLYPNPTSEELFIEGIEGDVSAVQVIDFNGNCVISGMENSKLNVHSLAPGVYFVRLIRDNKVEQKRFVKN